MKKLSEYKGKIVNEKQSHFGQIPVKGHLFRGICL